MSESHARLTPLVLLVDDQEWTSRSIESILRPKGHLVLKAYTGRQALDLVQKVSPDLVIVDFHLPDLDGVDLVRALRGAPTMSPVTPMLMMSSTKVGRAERLEALGVGVWDILSHPVDPSEFVLRIGTYVTAKQESDHIRDEGLTDPATGFYNVRGLLRRARELSADALRFDRPLACLAFGPEWFGQPKGQGNDAEELEPRVLQAVTEALKAATRTSDTVGWLGPGEFVIVAPGTDREGALRLADRVLTQVIERTRVDNVAEMEYRLRAGLHAARSNESVEPEDLLSKATLALRRAQADGSGFPVRTYEA